LEVGVAVGVDVGAGVGVVVGVDVEVSVGISVGVRTTAIGVGVSVVASIGGSNSSPLTLDANVSLGNDRVEANTNPAIANVRRTRPMKKSVRVSICPSLLRWASGA
jgi:hypothetical protein